MDPGAVAASQGAGKPGPQRPHAGATWVWGCSWAAALVLVSSCLLETGAPTPADLMVS